MFRRGPSINLVGAIYIVIGIFVAWDHNYFDNVDTFKEVLSAAFAIVLWPLVLIGVNLRIRK
jgi:SNF family Na+-dependent transporter